MSKVEQSSYNGTGPMSSTVIVLIPYSYPGGTAASLRVYNFVEGLVANGQKVHVVSFYHMPSRRLNIENYNAQNVSEYFIFPGRNELQFRNLFSYRSKVSKSFCEIVQRITSKEKVQLVYIYDGTSYAYFNAVTKLIQQLKIPMTFDITELRDSNYSLQTFLFAKDITFKGKLSNLLLFPDYYSGKKAILKRAAFFISISTSLKKYLEVYGKPVIILPGFERFAGPPGKPNPMDKVTLLYVGSLIERDAPQTLKLVVQEVLDHHDHVEVKFIGRYGTSKKGKELVEELQHKYGDHIVSLGQVGEDMMASELMLADILVLCRKDSLEERCAFPTRLAEYLALRKAILVSPIGDIPLYLEDGKDVGFVDLDDHGRLSDSSRSTIQRIISDEEFREKMAENGNKKGKRYFDNIRNAEEVLKQVQHQS